MAEKRLKQVPMYVKEIVYPDGENGAADVQLEMIRARRPCYQSTSAEECDMDMTEACPTNITLNVPAILSIEKRERGSMEGVGRETSAGITDKHELCEESVDPEQQQQLFDKENLPPTKNLFQFTPSAFDYSNSYSFQGVSSMIAKLSFSEADSTSFHQEGGGGLPEEGERKSRRLHAKLDCEARAQLSKEQLLFEAQFQNECKQEDTRERSRLVTQDSSKMASTSFSKSKSELDSFSVYSESSISIPFSKSSTLPVVAHENVNSEVESFSVFDDPSHSSIDPHPVSRPVGARTALGTLPLDTSKQQVEPDSFTIHTDQSFGGTNNPPVARLPAPRVALGALPLDTSRQRAGLDSFSVSEKLSVNLVTRHSGPRVALSLIPQDDVKTSRNDESLFSTSSTVAAVSSVPTSKDLSSNTKPSSAHHQSDVMESFSVYNESRSIYDKSGVAPAAVAATAECDRSRNDFSAFVDEKSAVFQSEEHGISSRMHKSSVVDPVQSFTVFGKTGASSSTASLSSSSVSHVTGSKIASEHKELSLPFPTTMRPLSNSPSDRFPNPALDPFSKATSDSFPNPVPDLSPNPAPDPSSKTTSEPSSNPSPDTEQRCLANETVDPSFFIPGYLSNDPTSTPTGQRVGLGLSIDMTVIHPVSPTEKAPPLPIPRPVAESHVLEKPHPVSEAPHVVPEKPHPPFRPFAMGLQHLDPIQEESCSTYTSSSSGTCSKLSASRSSNLSTNSQHNEEEELPEVQELRSCGVMNSKRQVNPFTPEAIQFMFQSLPISTTPIHRSSTSCPRMTLGHNITIGDSSCTVSNKLAKGGFASVYNVTFNNGQKKALKIQNPPFLWEVAIIEELHKRLQANDLMQFSLCFMSVDYVQLYSNASIIVYNYYPHGTLLDLANICRTTNKKLSESVLIYYALELMQLVDVLHSCGVMHADIKPDNIVLRDIRPANNLQSIRGRGLCILDFGRAIDVQAFPRGTHFIGSCDTDTFQCVQMLHHEPWSWQADLHGIAGTVHVLMHLDYMGVIKDSASGLHQTSKQPPRTMDRNLWTKFYGELLNWSDECQPDLKGISHPLMKKLSAMSSSLFINLKFMWSQMEKHKQ